MMKRPYHPERKPEQAYSSNSTITPIPQNARQAAYAMLQSFDETGEFASRLGEQSLWAKRLMPREKLLGLRIAETTIQRRLTIRHLLGKLANRPQDQTEKGLWRLLELGCAQLFFTPDIEPHAAVYETVELAGWMNQLRWKGFTNGILREIQRNLVREKDVALQSHDFTLLKLPGTDSYVNETLAPSPSSTAEYASFLYSLPLWLVEKWLKRYSEQEFKQICDASLVSGPLTLRVCKKTTRDALVDSWKGLNVEFSLPDDNEIIVINNYPELTKLPGFEEGSFFVQDRSAMKAVQQLAPVHGEKILDMCAAPGSKTIQMADYMNNTGEVTATDVMSDRLQKVEENIKRSRLENIKVKLISRDGKGLPEKYFDAVLVDAPCSNTGVLGKRPEVRARITAGDFNELARIQLNLLRKAVSCLKPQQGRIIYSTCSLEPEENKGVLKNFLKEFPEFTCESSETLLPQTGSSTLQHQDGAFWAKLTRI